MKTKDLHLVAFYAMKPRNPHMTHIKGYMKDPANIQYDEQIGFTLGLKTKDHVKGGVILNLSKKTVIKNTYNSEQKDFDAMFKYFLESYPQYVARVMADLDVDYLQQFLPKDEVAQADAEVVTPEVVETVSSEATVSTVEAAPAKKSRKKKTATAE